MLGREPSKSENSPPLYGTKVAFCFSENGKNEGILKNLLPRRIAQCPGRILTTEVTEYTEEEEEKILTHLKSTHIHVQIQAGKILMIFFSPRSKEHN